VGLQNHTPVPQQVWHDNDPFLAEGTQYRPKVYSPTPEMNIYTCKSSIWLTNCLFIFCRFENVPIIPRHLHCWWRVANFDLCVARTCFKKYQNLPWQSVSIFNVISGWSKPVRIRIRIGPPHPHACRKRRLNRVVLWMRPEKPWSRVTACVSR
jgi:hypothetical protein